MLDQRQYPPGRKTSLPLQRVASAGHVKQAASRPAQKVTPPVPPGPEHHRHFAGDCSYRRTVNEGINIIILILINSIVNNNKSTIIILGEYLFNVQYIINFLRCRRLRR